MDKMKNVNNIHQAEPRKHHGLLQVILVIAVLAAGIISNHLLSNNQAASGIQIAGNQSASVIVIRPELSDTQITLDETGTVQVRNSIELSPQVTGRVVYVSESLASGGTFKKNEVLFRLEDTDYKTNLERAKADLSARRADLRVEQSEADIAKKEWNLINPTEPVPANVAREPQLERARAAVNSAEAILADAQLDLERTKFSLPFDGRILATTIEIGQNLIAGQPYGKAYDPASIEISVPVTTTMLQALYPAVGRDAQVRLSQIHGAQRQLNYPAVVIRENAELDPTTRLAKLILQFTDAVQILPGEFVNVEINGTVVADTFTFPDIALQENRSVWVVESQTLVKRQPEIIFARAGKIVTRRFDIGDGIVVTPLNNPKQGMAVTISDNIKVGVE
ncbi:efflux RND transporter periplasmic adaptor subunit [Rheinheimera baltica]|uniref:Efflux RND transporter periplasmic adaptor subunit n=1 Tax=Rheinheimera baltica TaxID=67576 RepID=A0ABT9I340_9GAMM|nr:efflux RND transporter periplasmic adaptor subunit [Rheinheimera baltica]MDP5137460.1 efflux RND transporter periplasmic adaptor subunit [Rheinheimera baltica]